MEALASGRSIGHAARQNLPKDNILRKMSGEKPERIDAKMVFEAFRSGDTYAEGICMKAIELLSIGVANLIHLLDPTHVFIGGGVSQNSDLFWKPLNSEIRKRVLLPNRGVRILPAEYKEYATVIGSLAVVLDAVLGLEIR